MNWILSLTVFCALGGCAAGGEGDPAPLPTIQRLPGAEGFSDDLTQELGETLLAEGADYVPRTRHVEQDGAPTYSNRLLLESSPYLRQHAHNPVNWYPWGDEAFETARRLGRPVLLSIGYSTCHWCHVMEEESFEDEEIAAYMNSHYIAIKVDREERPDIDAIYMRAVQTLVGRGGWPMTTWLTPDREPFYGGTYFPARDGDRGARTGFLTLLQNLERVYRTQPDQVAARAVEITRKLRQAAQPTAGQFGDSSQTVERAVNSYGALFDGSAGGVNGAPKFPSSFPLRLLLRESERIDDPAPGQMALLTLRKMAAGGIYDQAGGGFHRYSTDALWLVPHFEKMLYDNARLVVAYLEAYQASGDTHFAGIAEEILDYALREMVAPSGGFYSATDADSLTPHGEREEGWFFTWTPEELREVLKEDLAELVGQRFGVTDKGNFEGRNILHVVASYEAIAGDADADAVRVRIDDARKKLLRARASRPAPLRDEKILTAWNGLMISALARGGFVLDRDDYVSAARRTASFILDALYDDGRLLRSFSAGRGRFNAYLDDYVLLIAGLLDLYEATGEIRWFAEAVKLQETLDRHYWDTESGGYYMTSDDHETLLAREKPAYDGAMPSGNSVALLNLVRLQAFTLKDEYRVRAAAVRDAFAGTLSRAPRALNEMLLALQFEAADPLEILIVVPKARKQAAPFVDVLRETYRPFVVLSVAIAGKDLTAQTQFLPPLERKVARKGKTTAYVCRRGVCRLPVTEVEAFIMQIEMPPFEQDQSDPEKIGVLRGSAIDSSEENR